MIDWETVQAAPRRSEYWIRISRVCNERCSFCNDEATMDGTMVPFAKIHEMLRASRSRGETEVNLTGGEPTMHPQFVNVVRLCRLLGYKKIFVTTNGRLFKDAAYLGAAAAEGLQSVGFSVHGHTAELNDRLTRAHGSFEDSIAGLRNAVALGLEVGVHVVATRLNAPYAAEILRYFKGLGADYVDFVALCPVSAAWDNRRELYPTEQDGWRVLWDFCEKSDDPELRSLAPGLLARHAEYVASTARVPGYAGKLDRLLKTGQPQPCRGEKCGCCPLDELCRDLEALRERGALDARPGLPPCLADSRVSSPRAPSMLREEATMPSFSEFFAEHRLRAKGRACGGCPKSGECAGAPVSYIIERGFPKPRPEWSSAAR